MCVLSGRSRVVVDSRTRAHARMSSSRTGRRVLYGDMAESESPPDPDELKMFDMYRELGGKSGLEEYRAKMRTFAKYTMNAYVWGVCLPDDLTNYKGPWEEPPGKLLFRNRDEADKAYMEAVKIDEAEYNRIFESVDSMYGWT